MGLYTAQDAVYTSIVAELDGFVKGLLRSTRAHAHKSI